MTGAILTSLRMQIGKQSLYSLVLLVLVATGIVFCKFKFTYVDPQVGRFVVPPENTKYFTFGYRDLVSDFLWIRAVQDFAYCDERDSTKTKSNYEEQHVFKHDLSLICNKGWVYQMVDRVTDLDPRFYVAYLAGGTM